jgi:hypothetical protein
VTDPRFSRPGKPATTFEQELLRQSATLEDPWVEVASIIGLDATLAVMDRFARCLLSCPSRQAFVGRLLCVWQDQETLRLRRITPRLSNREIARRVGVPLETLRKRTARALKRVPPKRA